MAQQIKKKFIQNDAVDGQKLKLQKDQSIRGQKQDGSEVELLKMDGSDKLVSGGQELAFKEVVDAQVSDLQDKLDSEEASRISGDETLQSNLNVEQSAREQADQGLQSSISSEEARAESEESRIESKLDSMIVSEESARESADQGLQSQINTEKGRVDAILLASDADKDSFAEIVQLINSVDTENDSAFGSYVLSNNAALASEVSSREQGDQDLQSNIDAEESRASDEESRIESKFDGMLASEEAARIAGDSAEQTRAMGIESSLQSQITQEVSDRQSAISSEESARQSADSSLQSSLNSEISDRQAAVSAEASARQAADSDLQSQHDDLDGYAQDVRSDLDDLDGYAQDIRSDLDQEIVDRAAAVSAEASARQSADSSLQSSLSSEVSRAQSAESTEQAARIAGDASLQSSLDSEISSRQSADSQLQSNIDSEQAARIAGDSSTLQSSKDYTDGKISLVMSNLDTEALDSLVEIVTAFQNADGDLNDTISSLSSAASSALAAEQAARISGDESLQSNLDAESDRAMSKESELEDSIDSEQSRAMDAESLIQSNLDAYSLQNDINLNSIHEQMQINDERAGAAEEGLRTELEAEIERAMAAEQGLEDNKMNRGGDSVEGEYFFDDGEGVVSSILGTGFKVEQDLGYKVLKTEIKSDRINFSSQNGSLVVSGDQIALSHIVPEASGLPEAGFDVFVGTDNNTMRMGQFYNYEGVTQPYLPVEGHEFTVKAYVDQQDSALSDRITALEVQTDGPYFQKQKFVIDETSELSSIELSHECMENSLTVCVGRLMVHKDEDYSVSVVDGKSVLTWMGDFAQGESEGIEEGDVIFVTFAREV
jgi:hypothetical protein